MSRARAMTYEQVVAAANMRKLKYEWSDIGDTFGVLESTARNSVDRYYEGEYVADKELPSNLYSATADDLDDSTLDRWNKPMRQAVNIAMKWRGA